MCSIFWIFPSTPTETYRWHANLFFSSFFSTEFDTGVEPSWKNDCSTVTKQQWWRDSDRRQSICFTRISGKQQILFLYTCCSLRQSDFKLLHEIYIVKKKLKLIEYKASFNKHHRRETDISWQYAYLVLTFYWALSVVYNSGDINFTLYLRTDKSYVFFCTI